MKPVAATELARTSPRRGLPTAQHDGIRRPIVRLLSLRAPGVVVTFAFCPTPVPDPHDSALRHRFGHIWALSSFGVGAVVTDSWTIPMYIERDRPTRVPTVRPTEITRSRSWHELPNPSTQ